MEERTSSLEGATSHRSDDTDAFSYLDRALDIPVSRREEWLRELESTQPAIATEIRRLLAAHATSRFVSFLNEPVTPPAAMTYATSGELIGSFRILNELGQGGMAVVYLAERADGQYSQRVALKILRRGFDGSQVHFHFAQERQILASLDHPSIARLIDAGVTATGLPYLAMEYVEGVPIDRYCDEKHLSTEARLALFLKVAEAIQYAHRHLIVHRDLKPSNIVVTNEGAVKLLDFGIAKLLAPGALEHAAPPTRAGVWLMTPEYASPEQIRGDPVSTATDIYQLGLLLYGLLAGQQPYYLRDRTPLDAFRVICESEPQPPSATTSGRLHRSLRGDLDAIVLKALRKEPTQRYVSVEWLIDDIRCHQDGLPVSAYEGVWFYRVGKFARRNVKVLGVAAIAVLTIALVSTWYTVRLADERNRAQIEAASATQVADFLTSVFRGSRTRTANGSTTARELLDRGAERIEIELANQPEVRARLLNVIGDAYVQYDLFDKAQPLLERALSLNIQLYGRSSTEAADSLAALAKLANFRSDAPKAISLYQEVLRIRERTVGPQHAATAGTLVALASSFLRRGDSPSATRAAERALDIYSHTVEPSNERISTTLNVLAGASFVAGDIARARTVYEQLLPRIERDLGAEHRNYAAVLGNVAYARIELGDYDGVEEQVRRSIQIDERMYGPDHGLITEKWVVLGRLFHETGRFSEALTTLQHAIDSQHRVTGPGDRVEAFALATMASTLRSRGDLEGALQRLQAAMDILRKMLGTSRDEYAKALRDYGEIQLERGNLAAAAPALTEALAALHTTQAPNHYETTAASVANALLLMRTGQAAHAEAEIRAAISTYQKVLPPGHRLIVAAQSALGESLWLQGKFAAAEATLLNCAQQLRGTVHYERRLTLQRLIWLYEQSGNAAIAKQFQTELAALEQRARSA